MRGESLIDGLAHLHAELRRLPAAVRAGALAGLEAAGRAVAARAAELAPRDTGALAASIDYQIGGEPGASATGDSLVALIGPAAAAAGRLDSQTGEFHLPAEYAERTEFGDETHDPQPYLRPALDQSAAATEAALANAIATALEDAR